MLNIISQRHDLLAQVIGDDLLVKAGRLDHDEQRVVAADEVAQVLVRLDSRSDAPDEEKEELTKLVKLASLVKEEIIKLI